MHLKKSNYAENKDKHIWKVSFCIGHFLSFLGFVTACDIGSEEYGTPYATFKVKVKGAVVAEKDGYHIFNIQVELCDTVYYEDEIYYEAYSKTYTDDSGNHQILTVPKMVNSKLSIQLSNLSILNILVRQNRGTVVIQSKN